MFEAHITVEPVFDKEFETFETECRQYHFRPAKLLMQKDRAETAEWSSKDSFCTGHHSDYGVLMGRGRQLIAALKDEGIKVWRFKIEEIILDERYV